MHDEGNILNSGIFQYFLDIFIFLKRKELGTYVSSVNIAKVKVKTIKK